MKRKLLAILTSVLLLCAMLPLGAVSVSAATTGTTGDCTWTLDGSHLTISGNGKMADYASNYRPNSPWDYSYISAITIEDGVTHIGDYAFAYCGGLTSLTIGNSVTYIGWAAFYNCTRLTSVTIPNSVTYIGLGAFGNCSALTSIVIGDSVKYVDDAAFVSCSALTDVYYVGSETDRANISIGESNDPLLNATWHYNFDPAYDHAYSADCDRFCNLCGEARWENFDSTFDPTQELSDHYSALSRVEGKPGDLVQVTIHMSVDYVVSAAKWSICYDTAVLELVDCDSPHVFASEYSTSLLNAQPFWIHWSSHNYGDAIAQLATLTFRIKEDAPHGEHPISFDDSCYAYWDDYDPDVVYKIFIDGAVYVNRHTYDDVCDPYCNVCGELRQDIHVYTDICDTTCDLCGQIRVAPHSYSTVCDTVCDLCEYVRQAQPHTYSYPCDVDCNVCRDVRIAEDHVYDYPCDSDCNVCGIKRTPADHAYDDHYDADCNDCGAVRSVKVTGGSTGKCYWKLVGDHFLTIYGNGAMQNYIYEYEVPETPWGKKIKEVVIEEGVTNIGSFAFEGCSKLTKVTIPEGVRYIGEFAFMGCSLTSITLPNSLTSIGWMAFYGCDFTTIDIPEGVTTIGGNAFGYCTNLTSITLPSSITSIEEIAFEGCDALTDVYYGGSEADKANITIDSGNDALLNATWHYAPCDHVYVSTTTPADCYNDGLITYTCSVCDDTYTEVLPALGHDLVEWEEFFCWQYHSYGTMCTRCDYIDGYSTPCTEHHGDMIPMEDKAPTCTEDGYTNGVICSMCGDSGYGEIIPALGHSYDNACDTDCNVCGEIRKVNAHSYSNACDTTCNVCGVTRVAPHTYSNACDRDCNLCGVTRIVPHVYDNDCDNACNLCGTKRKPANHVYDNGCDDYCNECGAIREELHHTYTDSCDRDCNVCGFFREPPHHYADKYDDTCDTCGEWREIVIVYGDADGDNKITTTDIIVLQQYTSGVSVELDVVSADADGDGEITTMDVIMMQQYAAGWDVTLGPI